MTTPPLAVREELAKLRHRECILYHEIEIELDRMKLDPLDLEAFRRWVRLCEMRGDALKAIGTLALAARSDFDCGEIQSGPDNGKMA